tara:strand:+ start:569 stop:685 length:117 start_codon:yes stop_codon:yes gene_type:complete
MDKIAEFVRLWTQYHRDVERYDQNVGLEIDNIEIIIKK